MAKLYRPKLPFGTLAFEVEIDCDQTPQQMLQGAGFGPKIFTFKIEGAGKQKRLLYLIPFFTQVFFSSVGRERVEKLGLRQGRIEELLALKQFHSKQLKYFPKTVLEFGTTLGEKSEARFFFLIAGDDAIFLRTHPVTCGCHSEASYVLAVAEDGLKRRIHKTPPANFPFGYKPYLPKTRHQIQEIKIPGFCKAVAINVLVDYSKSLDEMAEEAGLSLTSYGLDEVPPWSIIPLGQGLPMPLPQKKVKRQLIVVSFEGSSVSVGDAFVFYYKKRLQDAGLVPARIEDFLALTSQERFDLRSKTGGRLAIWGTSFEYEEQGWYLRTTGSGFENSELLVGGASSQWGSDHWAVCCRI